jgi:ATP-dependent Clp protease ATP-binding subunit ClpC
MDRDDALTEAAKLENLGTDLAIRPPDAPAIVPRRDLIAQLARCLLAPTVQPVLVGESGVGKTSVVAALASMAGRDRRRIIHVTAADLLAGAIFANQLEHKLRLVATSCQREKAYLFLDDLLAFVGAGSSSADPDGDVTGILSPYLRRGDVRIIATATNDGWMQVSRLRPAFARLFTPLAVPEGTREETMAVLEARRSAWQRRHGVRLSHAALEEAMDLAERLHPSRGLPGKVCDLLDAALALEPPPPAPSGVRLTGQAPRLPRSFEKDDVARAVQRLTGLPELLLVPSVPAPSETLRAFFQERILGQEHVIEPLVARIQMIKSRMCAPGRPLAAYLLAGPSGVGKTLVARTLAALLLGSERRLIRFDMSEFCSLDSVSRFLGDGRSSRNAIGLVDAALAQPFPIVLLDEIEKAHRAVFDVLLQLLGEGRLTDERGRTAYFGNAIILMTSNLGADKAVIEHPAPSGPDGGWNVRVERAVRRHFRPELTNRLTATFAFRPLTEAEIAAVAKREIERVTQRKGIAGRIERIWMKDAAFEAILRTGSSRELGVRPMERAVDALMAAPIARVLAEHPDERNLSLAVDVDEQGRGHATVERSGRQPGKASGTWPQDEGAANAGGLR